MTSVFSHLASASPNVNEIQSLRIQSPSFLNIIQQNDKKLLAVTSFTVHIAGADEHHIGFIDGVGDIAGGLQERIIDTTIKWPNEVTYVPEALFGQEGVLVANGFFDVIPFKNNSTGAVSFIDYATDNVHKLTADKKGFYYHNARWADLYGDGNYGVITARTNSTPLNHRTSELVYLTPNKNAPASYPWHEQVLYSGGPDTAFTLADFDHDGVKEIYAAEFFNQALSVTYFKGGKWTRRIIDDQIGPVFNIEAANLAGKDKPALLVTNHTHDQLLSGVFAYEVPGDISNDTFKKHILWQGIKTIKWGPGQAAPGKASAFYLTPDHNGKPSVLVDGDGAESVTILTPKSSNSDDWSYEAEEIFRSADNSIIGQSAILNATADHPALFFTPEYGNNRVHVFEAEK